MCWTFFPACHTSSRYSFLLPDLLYSSSSSRASSSSLLAPLQTRIEQYRDLYRDIDIHLINGKTCTNQWGLALGPTSLLTLCRKSGVFHTKPSSPTGKPLSNSQATYLDTQLFHHLLLSGDTPMMPPIPRFCRLRVLTVSETQIHPPTGHNRRPSPSSRPGTAGSCS